ncbi:glycosyltransferase family 4 protein [Microvirga lenta]|uniref:glycosyltransferase family 4 protein n=1 Tax=Microvirga lenta TaxID=2881337 RepID=UPI001CFF6A52|nr:glycosyltransferase [Microvirga lenta]MCB5176440.1 glycosyltransferase [Microvirga lenta]
MTHVLALLPFPVKSFLHLSTLRSLSEHGVHVHIAVESMDASPYASDSLDDFVQMRSLTDLSAEDYSRHSSVLAGLIEARGISAILQIGASMSYPLLPELKMRFPHIRIIDLMLNPYGHNWDHFLFENVIDTVVVESEFMADVIRNSTMRPARDIRVVRSGTRIGGAYSTLQTTRPLTVGYAGRLSEEKAPVEFVRVVQQASQRISAQFKIFGKGPMEREVLAAIRRADLQERISMEGFAPTNVEALSSLDVLIVPSRFDGRPAAIMEASALGVVTIAAGVGGIPEMLQDGVNGFCLTPWSVPAAVDRLCALAENKELLESMRRASRAFAEVEFNYDRMVLSYADILRAA